jgi:hypothetical protein
MPCCHTRRVTREARRQQRASGVGTGERSSAVVGGRAASSERVLVELFKGKEGDDRVRRETNGVRQEATVEGKRALSPERL